MNIFLLKYFLVGYVLIFERTKTETIIVTYMLIVRQNSSFVRPIRQSGSHEILQSFDQWSRRINKIIHVKHLRGKGVWEMRFF
jgi:hypothetical protein